MKPAKVISIMGPWPQRLDNVLVSATGPAVGLDPLRRADSRM